MQISFDIKKVTSFEDASAPFILYNSTRRACSTESQPASSPAPPPSLSSLTRKFAERVEAGAYPPLPALDELGELHFAQLTEDREWELLMEYVLPFPSMVKAAALPALPRPPALPDYGTHKASLLCEVNQALSSSHPPLCRCATSSTPSRARSPATTAPRACASCCRRRGRTRRLSWLRCTRECTSAGPSAR